MARCFPRGGWLLVLGGLLSIAGGGASAQELSDGWEALKNAQYKSPTRDLLRNLFQGKLKADPSDKTHEEAIDVAAKLVTYQVLLRHLEDKPGEIDKVFSYFLSDLNSISRYKPDSQPLSNMYRDKVRIHALKLIQYKGSRQPIYRLHGARVLARLTELGQPELADTLLEVLKDSEQTPAVHFYALRGLRDLLALPPTMPPLLDKARETACAEALVAFLERKPLASAGASADEINGFSIYRREGIRALARIHTPRVSDKVKPALVLARLAGSDVRVVPSPRSDERLEAAIGLARMQVDEASGYQPDYAALQIGRALAAMAQAYSSNQEPSGPKRMRPWKIDAVQLADALNALKTTAGKDQYVGNVVNKGLRILQVIERGNQVQAGDLAWFLDPTNDPPSKELFKGDAESTIKPSAGDTERLSGP